MLNEGFPALSVAFEIFLFLSVFLFNQSRYMPMGGLLRGSLEGDVDSLKELGCFEGPWVFLRSRGSFDPAWMF